MSTHAAAALAASPSTNEVAQQAKGKDSQKPRHAGDVTGNDALHPSEIQIDEDPSSLESLFNFLNLIVVNRITEPAQISGMFAKLPETQRAQIERRDKDAAPEA